MNPFLAGLMDEEDPWSRAPQADPAAARKLVAALPVGATPGTMDRGGATPTTMAPPPVPGGERGAAMPGGGPAAAVTPAEATAPGGAALPGQAPAPASAARETAAQGPEVSRPLRFELPAVDDMVQNFQEWQAVAAATPGVAQIVAPQLAAWRNLTVQQHARAFDGDPTASPEQAAAYARHMGVINGKLGKPMTWDEAARIADYVEDREDGATQRFLKAVGTGNAKGAQEWIDTVFGQDVTIVGQRPTKVDLHGAQVDDWEWTVKMPDGSQQAYTGTQLNFMYGDQQARVQYAQAERQRQIERAKLELENARLLGDPAKVGAAYRKLMEVQGVGGGVTTANLPEALAPYAPFLGRLRNQESGGNINIVSKQNAVGLDQFTQVRLDDYNKQFGTQLKVEDLKNNVPLQNQVAAWHYPDIDRFIQDNNLKQFVGKPIKGVTVTLDGMRAAAHLGGNPGLKRYLESGGESDPPDANGMRRVDYMRKFQGETVPLGGGPVVALDAEDAAIGQRILQAGAGKAAGDNSLTPGLDPDVKKEAIKTYYKMLEGIQNGLDSDAIKERRVEKLNEDFAPILGGVIPGLTGGLTPEEAALFGTGGAGTGTAAGGGTGGATPGGSVPAGAAGAGSGGAGTGVPTPGVPDQPLSERMAIKLAEEQRARTERRQTAKKREEQEAARLKLRERLSEIERTWVDTRADEAKRKAVMVELEAMEKDGTGYLTTDDRKAIERLARLLYR